MIYLFVFGRNCNIELDFLSLRMHVFLRLQMSIYHFGVFMFLISLKFDLLWIRTIQKVKKNRR